VNVQYLAQKINIGGQVIEGPLVISGVPSDQITLATIVNQVVTFVIPLASLLLFFVLVLGGYGYLMSQGNPEKVKSAQAKLTAGIIGFVLLILSYLAIRLITYIFGFEGGII
jgi:hypothetical protein